jgi:copper chaperone CopZ
MKYLQQLLFVLVTAMALSGAEPRSYSGDITGVVCSACKDHVITTLMKLQGISLVEIIPGEKPESRKIIVKCDRDTLSATELSNALALAHGDSYKVTDLAIRPQ